jgi:hypothetical protein
VTPNREEQTGSLWRRTLKKKETRNIRDVYPVGPATVRDLKKIGIAAVGQLAGQDARMLHDRMCRL